MDKRLLVALTLSSLLAVFVAYWVGFEAGRRDTIKREFDYAEKLLHHR